MTNREWLSLTEIAQHWSHETGESAEALERELDAWFSNFVTREPSRQFVPSDGDGNTTNRLMGLLGGRYLQRETFAVFCEERGHDMPQFWCPDDAEGEGPDEPVPDPRLAASDLAPGRAASAEPAATGEPAGMAKGSWPGPNAVRHSTLTAPAGETARPLFPATGGLSDRKAVRLTGALVLGLSLLAVGFVLGQGGTESSESGASVAGQDQLAAPIVSSLRSELEGAQRLIANLSTELEASEQEAAQLYADLLVAQQALERDTGQFETEVASLNIEPSGCGTSEHTLYVQADHVNVRAGPGTSYGVKLQVNKGRSLVRLDRRGDWFRMTYEVGKTTKDGWIHSSLVSTDCL
jgi:hypothetical protein